LGKPMVGLPGSIDLRHSHSLTTRRRNAVDGTWAIARRKQNDVVRIPCSAAPIGSVGQYSRSASFDTDAFQLSAGEESHRPAIGRPERVTCFVGSGQRLCGNGIEWPEPKLRWTIS